MRDIQKKIPYRKIALATVLILFMGLVAMEFWKDSQTYTVAKGEQSNGLGTSYGYEVENYRYSHGIRITLWTKTGSVSTMKSIYEMPLLTVEKIGRNEWIKSDGAVYLAIKIIDNSSLNTVHSMQLIYDFHTGQMYVTSDLALWRVWSNVLSKDDWISEREFDTILAEFQR